MPHHPEVISLLPALVCMYLSSVITRRVSNPFDIVCISSALTLGAGAVGGGTELVLLRIGASKDKVADEIEGEDGAKFDPADAAREINQITGLQSVCKGDPRIQSKGKHETKAIYDKHIPLSLHGCRYNTFSATYQ